MMKALLNCRHEIQLRELSDITPIHECTECHTARKVVAIECREWHVHCDRCRFGKWCGQSIMLAEGVANQHYIRTVHVANVDYQAKQEWKDAVRDAFGRTVKWRFDAPIPENKFLPEMLVKVTANQLTLDDKEVPF